MTYLTPQERRVLIVVISVMLVGQTVRVLLRHYPRLDNIVNLLDQPMVARRVDLNQATLDELVAIPYIGVYTANQILRHRQQHGPFTKLIQLQQIPGIREKNYQRFVPYLTIGGR